MKYSFKIGSVWGIPIARALDIWYKKKKNGGRKSKIAS